MREHLCSVYIMASLSGVLYIGVTSDLQARIRQHKAAASKVFPNKYRCHHLVYYERYDYIQAAIGREKQLKGFTRKKKIALIESLNPRWQDLSESWEREHLVPRQSMKAADEGNAKRTKLSLGGSGPKSLTRSNFSPKHRGRSFAQKKRFRMTDH